MTDEQTAPAGTDPITPPAVPAVEDAAPVTPSAGPVSDTDGDEAPAPVAGVTAPAPDPAPAVAASPSGSAPDAADPATTPAVAPADEAMVLLRQIAADTSTIVGMLTHLAEAASKMPFGGGFRIPSPFGRKD